ncbi:hypothetical protein CEXT_487201 [Caerostris extrusa]|uniref:Uncharacterized protein n=1 Tax=Caerostris extrusa TaxID=172846 RepID=A0AAV4MIE0_CAEEX|nr:hypothetical protein CEXT_487201 [Caerostris extrusa]
MSPVPTAMPGRIHQRRRHNHQSAAAAALSLGVRAIFFALKIYDLPTTWLCLQTPGVLQQEEVRRFIITHSLCLYKKIRFEAKVGVWNGSFWAWSEEFGWFRISGKLVS